MGRYTNEAYSFRAKIASIKDSLNSLTGKLNSIASDLQKNDGDAISSNVLSKFDGISSQKDKIIANLEAKAAQVMDKGVKLDEEEERKRREDEEKKKSNNTSGGGNRKNTNVNMIK